MLESWIELTIAERQIDYVGDSGNEDWSTFLEKPGWDRIRIRLFVRKVKNEAKLSASEVNDVEVDRGDADLY